MAQERSSMTDRIMDETHGADWHLYNGDSAEMLAGLPDKSVDMSVFSPPFSSTYTYSPSDRDLGNVSSNGQFWQQFRWISTELLRVMKPGRLVAIHVANLPAYKNTHGYSGRRDFRGDTIRHFEDAGFYYHSEITIDKNPQAQAIRTHSHGLLFAQLQRDARHMWQCWADYVVVMRTPGENDTPVKTDLTQEDWIDWAHATWSSEGGRETDQASVEWADRLASQVWYDVRETDVLGVSGARENDDERHLCPLQLPVIERAVRLWSNPGEVILSPFAGIGSEGVGALRNGRKFIGCELKPSYYRVAGRNLRAAESEATAPSLFDEATS
jgi:DNA modification methylase